MGYNLGLLALACGTFALGMAEFSMMGILSPVAGALGLTIPEAGDFISAYALGVSVGSPLPLFVRFHPYKHILIGLCAIICLGNILVACSGGYWTMFLFRFLSGLPHGAYFGVAAIFATALVEPGRRATAVAIMISGMTFANLAGVPTATWLANTFSWRAAFVIAAFFGCAALAGILAFTPTVHPKARRSLRSTVQFLTGLAPWLIFLATFTGQAAIYCWYSYMEPIMLQIAKVPAPDMKWVMVVAGLGMVCGNLLSGRLADHFHPALISAFTAVSIIPTLALIWLASSNMPLAIAFLFIGAMDLFAIGGPMQYLIVRFSRGGEILGGAGIQIAFNTSNAFAAWLGGCLINAQFGLASPALAGIPLACVCAAILFWFYFKYRSIRL